MSPLGIVITIVFIVLVLMLVRYIFSDPYTLQNIQNGQTSSTIKASSLATNGSGVSSANFAYSIWFYINDWNYRYGQPKVIFGRMGTGSGSGQGDIPGVNGKSPCPALVLDEITNNLNIYLSCYPGTQSTEKYVVKKVKVTNIPIQRWVNLVISVYGLSLDVYMDGKLVQTNLLPGTANINSAADIYVTPAGGFDGWTAKLQYYPSPLNPQEVWNIYSSSYANLSNMFNSYSLKVSLLQNGRSQGSVSI